MALAITGATGFVGRALIKRAIGTGIPVRAVAVAGRGHPPPCPGLEVVEVPSFEDDAALARAFDGMDAVIHLAGRAHQTAATPAEDRMLHDLVNHRYTLAVGWAAVQAKTPRLVFASSIAVYGRRASSAPLTEKTLPSPSTPYGQAKLAAETGLRHLAENHGLAATALRLPLIAGPGAPGNLKRLARLAVRGLPVRLTGNNRRSLLSVSDAAEAFLAASVMRESGFEAYCVADPHPLSTSEIMATIAKGAGHPPPRFGLPSILPNAVLRIFGKSQLADQLFGSLVVDDKRFAQTANWTPSHGVMAALMELGRSHVGSRPRVPQLGARSESTV